uniref:Uncharacterized protein n=1 Tax=Monodelphis domestica TaxID=13616 RepID=A0A5F8HAE1_MONDO
RVTRPSVCLRPDLNSGSLLESSPNGPSLLPDSDEYLTLPGPRWVPIIKHGLRWKFAPMGRDAIGQWWYTGLTTEIDPNIWYNMAKPLNRPAYNRWHQSYIQQERLFPPAYTQHLRESLWYDPITPAQYMNPSTRWGSFRWQDKHFPGKEFVVNRTRFGISPGRGSSYVPFLSESNRPCYTIQNYRTWNLEPYSLTSNLWPRPVPRPKH